MLLYREVAILPRWCGNLESFFLFCVISLRLFLYFLLHLFCSAQIPGSSFLGVLFLRLTPVCLVHTSFLVPHRKQGPLQRIPVNSTDSVGLFHFSHQLMLPAWNVPSTCPPIEQELVEQCRLLLLALAAAVDGGEARGPISREVPGTRPNSFTTQILMEGRNESGNAAGLVSRTAERFV